MFSIFNRLNETWRFQKYFEFFIFMKKVDPSSKKLQNKSFARVQRITNLGISRLGIFHMNRPSHCEIFFRVKKIIPDNFHMMKKRCFQFLRILQNAVVGFVLLDKSHHQARLKSGVRTIKPLNSINSIISSLSATAGSAIYIEDLHIAVDRFSVIFA